MKNLAITIVIDECLYKKDPDSSELGRKILTNSIQLINDLGFEDFTFRKLGVQIGSNESSVYRYFENKHMLLLYLLSWYWSWKEYKLVFSTGMHMEAKEKLSTALTILLRKVEQDESFSYINEILLEKIVVAEGPKAYHIKDVDSENAKGYYKAYKRIVQRVSDMVINLNPDFEFPHMLVSTVIEGVQKQRYFSEHLPTLTDTRENEDVIEIFYKNLTFNAILGKS